MTAAKRRFVLCTLVAVNLVAGPVAAWLIISSNELVGRYAYDVVSAQMLLLPFWAVLGTNRLAVRVIGSAIGCALCSLGLVTVFELRFGLFSFTTILMSSWYFFLSAAIRLLVVAGALILMWLNGLCLVRFGVRIAADESGWSQFSLKRLFVFIGIAAVLLGLSNVVHFVPVRYLTGAMLASRSLDALSAALITCVVLRAALSPAPPPARLALAGVLVALIAIVRAYAAHIPVENSPAYVQGAVVGAGWLAGCLLVVRACGYRALWPSDWVWAATQADQVEPCSNAEST